MQEFRAHSIVFATRGLLVTLVCLGNLYLDHQQSQEFASSSRFRSRAVFLVSVAVVLAANEAAARVTDALGDRELRTTNAMPYPPEIPKATRKDFKRNYMVAQYCATVLCVMGVPSMAFWTALPIQLAAFLMTLVRKGKISALRYHQVAN